jgi:hypothetical protein
MAFFHGDTSACIANELHSRQFIFAHMLGIYLGGTTKTTFGFIPTWIA